ncbi:interferon-induced protein 44 [Artibeus jamaicensis]|uniref:interferon-induced protein 44 n=1 Tax=Artibeus jamaicensis TaxID=9417 RepID=UPI00235AF5F1|nr:interferon-induced protein 44 [Artibeus jamaicensis]
MAVTTRLTWMQEKKLQNFLGGKRFSFLLKISAHEYESWNLLRRGLKQGPTITVFYTNDRVIVAYMSQGYVKNNTSTILFTFEGTKILNCKIQPSLSWQGFDSRIGYLYGNSDFQVNLGKGKVTMSLNAIEKLALPQCQTVSFQECEVFRCEDLLDTRKMTGLSELRESLLSAIRTYKPYRDLIHRIRILLLGPVGAGKSSFFNSIKSVFRGRVTHQALVDSDRTGKSEQYRTYSIKDVKDGNILPFVLCDSMGLSEKKGLCLDDIFYILKGHIPDRYQFNFMKPITPGCGNYIDSPALKDRIHCAAFVLDANSIEHLSDEMVAKIKRARREMIKCGVVYLVLLTCVDSMDLIVRGDLIDVYRCMPVKLKIQQVHRKLGFAISDILVVSNYTSEWELDPVKDVLNLSALRQMLLAADEFLEDLPLEETGIKERQLPSVQKKN